MGNEVYSHRGGAIPFLGYSWLDIYFASSISQAMYCSSPADMVATPLFMASRNHTALSCLLLTTYYLLLTKGRRAIHTSDLGCFGTLASAWCFWRFWPVLTTLAALSASSAWWRFFSLDWRAS